MASFWHSGIDYDIEGESKSLQTLGEPFLMDYLRSEGLDYKKPLVSDFGCWSGRHLRMLERVAESNGTKNAHRRIIGIDEPFAKPRLAEARKAYRGFPLIDTGIARTGLPSSSVDAAISWRVFHNLTEQGEWTKAILELRRILKHGAPVVISVRSTLNWMVQNAPVPMLYRTYTYGTDRDDLYFSEEACYAMFRFYGFDVAFDVETFTEEEVLDGKRISNEYKMLCLVANKRQSKNSGLSQPHDTNRPGKSLREAYSIS